jgi:hypothetical protein
VTRSGWQKVNPIKTNLGRTTDKMGHLRTAIITYINLCFPCRLAFPFVSGSSSPRNSHKICHGACSKCSHGDVARDLHFFQLAQNLAFSSSDSIESSTGYKSSGLRIPLNPWSIMAFNHQNKANPMTPLVSSGLRILSPSTHWPLPLVSKHSIKSLITKQAVDTAEMADGVGVKYKERKMGTSRRREKRR